MSHCNINLNLQTTNKDTHQLELFILMDINVFLFIFVVLGKSKVFYFIYLESMTVTSGFIFVKFSMKNNFQSIFGSILFVMKASGIKSSSKRFTCYVYLIIA